MMSRWVPVCRLSGVGSPYGGTGHGPCPRRRLATKGAAAAPGEAAPCIPGQLAANNACSATMGTRSHTCFCLLSTHCRRVATPCSRVLLEGGDRRRLIQAMVFSLSVLHSAVDACC